SYQDLKEVSYQLYLFQALFSTRLYYLYLSKPGGVNKRPVISDKIKNIIAFVVFNNTSRHS
ncbi:MAG TPA: hypothetical protein VM935_16440, partial [Chitinophagaceae bacterium]|nr:hypothetical protein [Chitinophagaceae bacterium]